MSNLGELLLYTISARREMNWLEFKKIFDTLYLRQTHRDEIPGSFNLYRYRTLQTLDSLGHCDVFFDERGGRLFVAPPIFARLPFCGLPQAVLCGLRSPQLIPDLMKHSRSFKKKLIVRRQTQESSRASAPERVVVEAESNEVIEELAGRLKIIYNEMLPAWSIIHFAGSLREYIESRDWRVQPELNWRCQDFNPDLLQFRPRENQNNNLRLSAYADPMRPGLKRHLLWRDGSYTQVGRDWGRYALLHWLNQNILVYNFRSLTFAVPSTAPLPRLFARTLAFCSGFVTRFVEKTQLAIDSPEQFGFDIYTGVPPEIARMVAEKLGQQLSEIEEPSK